MSALVIEDDPVTGAALSALLRKNGWRVEWAADIAGAKTKIAVFDPDMILADVTLQRGTSVDFLASDACKTRRVVVLTGADDKTVAELKRRVPQAEVLIKPTDPADIVRIVGRGRKGVLP